MSEDDSSFLTVLLDITPDFWHEVQHKCHLDASNFLEQLYVFLRTYTLLNDENQLAVFAIQRQTSHLLYASTNCSQHLHPATASNHGKQQTSLGDAIQQIHSKILQLLDVEEEATSKESNSAQPTSSLFSNGLSRALCFINKVRKTTSTDQQNLPQPRILCISACPDVNLQYIAVMNAIFAAQRSSVIIDALKLGEHHSAFLQQASHLTGGMYLKPSKPAALVQYLMTAYAAAAETRKLLRLPKTTSVDFRASCFCHKRPVDIGYVCSVCLSIFCEKVPVCSTCHTKFES